MLRALLVVRFALKTRVESRTMDIYALVVAKPDRQLGPKLQSVSVDCTTRRLTDTSKPGLFPPDSRPDCGATLASGVVGGGGATSRKTSAITMAAFATSLEPRVGRPVIDRTGLDGTFDLELQLTNNARPPSISPDVQLTLNQSPLVNALREQLGLTLRAERAPVNVLVIESINKPTSD